MSARYPLFRWITVFWTSSRYPAYTVDCSLYHTPNERKARRVLRSASIRDRDRHGNWAVQARLLRLFFGNLPAVWQFGAPLSRVPVFVVFIAFRRYLVEGISATGLRG